MDKNVWFYSVRFVSYSGSVFTFDFKEISSIVDFLQMNSDCFHLDSVLVYYEGSVSAVDVTDAFNCEVL